MRAVYAHKAADQLVALPNVVQKRIALKMRFFAEQPDPLVFAERLTDHAEGDYRFRVGDYRIIFDVADGKIAVLKIGKRDSVY